MKERRRLALLLLALAGVLISHTVGYWIGNLDAAARADALDAHSHMTLLGWLVAPGGLAAVGWLAVRGARAAGPSVTIGWPRLAGLMASVLAAQELAERLLGAGALSEVVTEPGVWWSLVATLAVASVLVLLVGMARRVVELLDAKSPARTVDDLVARLWGSLVPVAGPAWSPVSARGPPF